ncbi:MAG: response regulator [Gallionellaceae bacterium]
MSDDYIRLKVMVVDDTAINLELMNKMLSADYDLQLVNSGKKAIELAEASPPDLILLDIVMPELDGFEVCRHLKDNPKTSHVPIIFITAKNEIEDEKLGFELGASDFIHKPVSAPILAARVKTHLRIKLMVDFFEMESSFLQDQVSQHSVELEQLKDFIWPAAHSKR